MNQTPVRIGVLAVQGDVREHIHVLTTLGVQAAPVRRPGELDDVDALVIPGGESTTMDKLVRAFELRGPLRKRLADGMPAYGSCAGMIMLADHLADARPDQLTLGGIDMTVRRNAFGRQVDSFEADLEIAQLRDGTSHPLRAIFIRAPWVEQVGPEVQVLARVASGGGDRASADGHDDQAPPRIVAVRQGNVLATSFHPEVSGDHRIHEYFVELVRAART